MSKTVYKITIKKWFDHNPKSKKGYTHFMVSKRIFNDHKIAQLNASEFRLYIYLLSVCADFATDCIQVNYNMIPSYIRVRPKLLSSCIHSLELLQLLTVEKNDSLLNRIEKNRKEKKRIEVCSEAEKPEIKKPEKIKNEIVCSEPENSGSKPTTIPKNYFEKVTPKIREMWLQTYQDQVWIEFELKKALTWIETNPHKAPKSRYVTFFNGWLSRGWERYRKGLDPSTKEQIAKDNFRKKMMEQEQQEEFADAI